MKGRKTVMSLAALVSVALLLGIASAHPGNGQDSAGTLHEEMETLMEEGTYSDLVELRETYDRNFMPWVESEEDFDLAKKMHERMEEYRNTNGFYYGMKRGYMMGRGMHAGCPMAEGA